MATDDWARIAAIVEEAIALPAAARAAFLKGACRDSADLDRQVRSLLAHHEKEESLRPTSEPFFPPLAGSSTDIAAAWTHDRFEQLTTLGTGGFGNVYKAFDRVRHQWVALKILRHADPVRLDRFKQEFRKTTAITHPNIVTLHELFSDGGQWSITMELVDGVTMLDYIRGPRPWTAGVPSVSMWQRLYPTFEQLVRGVSALHAAGIVHGDLKPQNVLVTAQGRVVLLDFGLVREIAQQPSLVAGTPEYMAPEQLVQAPVAEAADWYSVGVLLYEALTAAVPFSGTFWNTLWKKQGADIRLPKTNDLPEPIVSLCHALLQRQPDRRPTGSEILEQLGGSGAEASVRPAPDPQALFVGRQRELEALQTAFERVASGQPTSVHLEGVSGIGKSRLVRQFLDTVRRENESVVVLSGRCYESESVPFKAFDELVDGLSRYLGRLEAADVGALWPRDLSLLTRLFPALRRVAGIESHQRHPAEAPSAQETRDRALAALRELLQRLTERRRVVLWIDDLQWGDLDSLRVLRDLQRPAGAPCLLLILSYRREDVAVSPVIRAIKDTAREAKASGSIVEITVSELRREEAQELADALYDTLSEAERVGVVDEAAGSPLFLHELGRHVTARRKPAARPPTLVEVIQQRVDSLRPSSRRLLNMIAVAGQPLERRVAAHAAEPDEDAAAESWLIAEGLIRVSRSTATGELVTHHDKVREAVLSLMSDAERRECHGRLARALEAEGTTDPERLVHHFTKAGIEDAAYRCALQAARTAEDCLAFDRAASLFRLALDLHPRISSSFAAIQLAAFDLSALWRKLARALADAGRGAEAARAYLQAADLASPPESSDLRSLAVDQLMRSGQTNEGMSLLTATLRERGTRMPRRQAAVLAAVVATRIRIRLRGLEFREREADQIDPRALTQIDRLWTASATLTAIDPPLGAYIRGQHLLLALRTGEPTRISMGLALEAVQRAMEGLHAHPAARRILDRAREIAIRSQQPYAEGIILTGEAGVAYFSARFGDMFRYGVQAEEVLSAKCTGVAWELATVRGIILSALALSGQWKAHTLRLEKILRDAESNGDRYAQLALPLTAGAYVRYLAADDPAAARRELDERISQWPRTEFDNPRAGHWQGTVETLLYEYRYEEAWQLVVRTWPILRRTYMLRIEFLRLLVGNLRARCAVARLSIAPNAETRAVAERFVADCARAGSPVAQGWGLLIDAALRVSRGQRESAIAKLQLAEERLRDVGAIQLAAASRRRRGELLNNASGATLIRDADSQLTDLGAVNPSRMVNRLVPGAF